MASQRSSARLGADERRTQLLGVALETFGEKGFTATSMNDVAEAAGITKPVLYQHFESKHDLYFELLSETGTALVTRIQAAVESADGPRHQVEAAFQTYFDFFADRPSHFTVIYGDGVRTNPAFTSELRSVEDSFIAFTAQFIDIAGLTADDRNLIARAIAGLLEASVRRWIQGDDRRSAEEMAVFTAEFVWRGLRGVGSRPS